MSAVWSSVGSLQAPDTFQKPSFSEQDHDMARLLHRPCPGLPKRQTAVAQVLIRDTWRGILLSFSKVLDRQTKLNPRWAGHSHTMLTGPFAGDDCQKARYRLVRSRRRCLEDRSRNGSIDEELLPLTGASKGATHQDQLTPDHRSVHLQPQNTFLEYSEEVL